jgi:hypothetical protein
MGLYGTFVRADNQLIPFYNIVVGGRLDEGNSALAETIAGVPAKVVPDLLKDFWTAAVINLKNEESLSELMNHWGKTYLRELVRKYEDVPLYKES